MAGKCWKKLSVEAGLVSYSNIVTASGKCLSVAIILTNKIDFSFVHIHGWFPKSSHIIMCSIYMLCT